MGFVDLLFIPKQKHGSTEYVAEKNMVLKLCMVSR